MKPYFYHKSIIVAIILVFVALALSTDQARSQDEVELLDFVVQIKNVAIAEIHYVGKIADKQIYHVVVSATANLVKSLPVSVSNFYMITIDNEIVDGASPPSYKKLSCRGLFPGTKTTGYIAFQSDQSPKEMGYRK